MNPPNTDPFYDALRNRLHDYEEPLPAGGWAGIAPQLPPVRPLPLWQRRPLRRRLSVLALLLLLLIPGSVVLWQHYGSGRGAGLAALRQPNHIEKTAAHQHVTLNKTTAAANGPVTDAPVAAPAAGASSTSTAAASDARQLVATAPAQPEQPLAASPRRMRRVAGLAPAGKATASASEEALFSHAGAGARTVKAGARTRQQQAVLAASRPQSRPTLARQPQSALADAQARPATTPPAADPATSTGPASSTPATPEPTTAAATSPAASAPVATAAPTPGSPTLPAAEGAVLATVGPTRTPATPATAASTSTTPASPEATPPANTSAPAAAASSDAAPTPATAAATTPAPAPADAAAIGTDAWLNGRLTMLLLPPAEALPTPLPLTSPADSLRRPRPARLSLGLLLGLAPTRRGAGGVGAELSHLEASDLGTSAEAVARYQLGRAFALRTGLGYATQRQQVTYTLEQHQKYWISVTNTVVRSNPRGPDTLRIVSYAERDTVVSRQRRHIQLAQQYFTLPLHAEWRPRIPFRWQPVLGLGATASWLLQGQYLAPIKDECDCQTKTQRGRGAGPFRPASLALSAGLGLDYALGLRSTLLLRSTASYWPTAAGRAGNSRPVAIGLQVGLLFETHRP